MGVTEIRRPKLPEAFGFRNGTSSVHSSRTMMLSELSLVLEHVAKSAKSGEYMAAVIDHNILGKPTQTTRKLTAQRLTQLYSFDQTHSIFRVLRHFWSVDASSRPMLAFMAAATRDSLLRDTTPFVIEFPAGSAVNSTQIAALLNERFPARFKPSTLASTAQNLASSWTQAGYLNGRLNKKRARPIVTSVVATYALLLGYLCGVRGKMLLDTTWARLLDRTTAEIAELAMNASKQGWMSYKGAGSVVEITFPGLLTPLEEKASNEPN